MDDKRPVKPSITSESNGDEGYREEQVRENSDWRSEWRSAVATRPPITASLSNHLLQNIQELSVARGHRPVHPWDPLSLSFTPAPDFFL
jgi:hypothetical protein